MVQVEVGKTSITKIIKIMKQERKRAKKNDGFGHPGISSDEFILQTLDAHCCKNVQDDVLRVPYYDEWRTPKKGSSTTTYNEDLWRPILREDGHVGLFKSEQNDYFVIVSNALPYFVCDQLRVISETNPKQMTWNEWRNSPEIKRATELSEITAHAICDRVISKIELINHGFKRTNKKTIFSMFNIIAPAMGHSEQGKESEEVVAYDSGVIRSSLWSPNGTLICAGQREHFMWLKNIMSTSGKWMETVGGQQQDYIMPTHFNAKESLDKLIEKLESGEVTGLNLKLTRLNNVENTTRSTC